jgi:prophage DNA circulation protein
MANLTSEQATALGNNFLDLAQSITDFTAAKYDSISQSDRKKLTDNQLSAKNASESLFAYSTILSLDETESSLKQVDDVTTEIKSTLNELKEVQKGINVCAAIGTLGTAIINRNPSEIGSAIGGLVNAWNS